MLHGTFYIFTLAFGGSERSPNGFLSLRNITFVKIGYHVE